MMKYLFVAMSALFIGIAYTPTANAATCVGGVYNPACIAGAYNVVVVRRGAVVRRPVVVRRRAVVVR
jgi:hypothetical protein